MSPDVDEVNLRSSDTSTVIPSPFVMEPESSTAPSKPWISKVNPSLVARKIRPIDSGWQLAFSKYSSAPEGRGYRLGVVQDYETIEVIGKTASERDEYCRISYPSEPNLFQFLQNNKPAAHAVNIVAVSASRTMSTLENQAAFAEAYRRAITISLEREKRRAGEREREANFWLAFEEQG